MQEPQNDRFSMALSPARVLVRNGVVTDEVDAVRPLPFVRYVDYINKTSIRRRLNPKREKLLLGDRRIRRPWMEWARGKIQCAIDRGEITRPNNCSTCDVKAGVIFGHHDDYNKPLSVRWLCRSCHRNWHLHNDPVIPEDFEALKRSLAIRVRHV